MPLTRKEITDIFDNIKRGQAILLVGQAYLKTDSSYYNCLLKNLRLNSKEILPTLNELWEMYQGNTDALKSAMQEAGNNAVFLSWLRAVLSMGWNAVYASATNIDWMLSSVGDNFSVNLQDRTMLEASMTRTNFRKLFNKKNMPMIPLFGTETSLPENKQALFKLKNVRELFVKPCENILSQYGNLIIDGLETDDWIDVKLLQHILESAPSDCIYIFGMNEKKLENMCQDDEQTLFNIQNALNERIIQLCEKTLREVVEELGLTEDDEFDDENHSGDVRISIGKDDALWLERSECIRLQNMGITLLRDELMSSLNLRRRDICEEFSNFLRQDSAKDWNYFRIADERVKSFHIKRKAEDMLWSYAVGQLRKSASDRNIVLLKGNSNTGKSTSLCWLAREVYENPPSNRKAGDRCAVLYINGDPAMQSSYWMEELTEFIKDQLYDRSTVKGQRVCNVMIIWDNESSQNKWESYEKLNTYLNECNIVLVGSIYEFESKTFKQGNHPLEVPISAMLDKLEKDRLDILIKAVYPDLYIPVVEKIISSHDKYLFEILTHFAEYNYSPAWDAYKNRLRAKLEKEANQTEIVSYQELENFLQIRKEVLTKGIGAFQQLKIEEMEGEEKVRVEPLRNIIADLNLILAVAGQFNKTVALPESLLLRTVIRGVNPTIYRETDRIRKILRLDSMVKYDSSAETGLRFVSFRHPSEAAAYLENTFGKDDSGEAESSRKNQEIEVLKRLIKNCDWETTTGIPEAMAVTALIRCFGANSYGKIGEEYDNKGQYKPYIAYWEEIVDELYEYAGNNPDAMLIVGHFTRELIQHRSMDDEALYANDRDDALQRLDEVYDMMRDCVRDDCSHPKAATARLYGEMCRNLLEQMNILRIDTPESEARCEEFINTFKEAVKITNECNRTNHKVGTILLLDIWLNFALAHGLEQYLPDTLEYIESLLYDEGDFIDESNDIANVIEKINRVYELISRPGCEKFTKLQDLLLKKGNDSWAYFRGKLELVKVYDEFKGDNTDSENSFGSEKGLSPRVFFLNEYAADDFSGEEYKPLFEKIKKELRTASEKIIIALDKIYKHDLRKMSFRCLRMYLQAKWMFFTGNLMLEYDQRPGLSDANWNELYSICCEAFTKRNDAQRTTRAMTFISDIYRFVFEGRKWDSHRGREHPNRRICLCSPVTEDGIVYPRLFRVYTQVSPENKVKAKVNKEVVNGQLTNMVSKMNEDYSVYVPETVLKHHTNMRTSGQVNIPYPFEIWFNLGGPQLKDSNEEV